MIWCRLVVLATLGAFAATFVACDGDEPTPPVTPSAVTATSAPFSTATPGQDDEPPIFRALIQAARENDAAAIEALVRYEAVPCTTKIQNIGGPPACREGEAAGTPVEVVFATTCEGYYARRGDLNVAEVAFGVFGSGDALYGVYKITAASQLSRTEDWSGAKYAIVLNRIGPADGTLTYAIISDGESIIGTATGCGETPEEWVEVQGLSEPILTGIDGLP